MNATWVLMAGIQWLAMVFHEHGRFQRAAYDPTRSEYYFVTICAKHRLEIFGEILDGKLSLSNFGEIAHDCWMEIPMHFPHVTVDEFVIMPNHIHGILLFHSSFS